LLQKTHKGKQLLLQNVQSRVSYSYSNLPLSHFTSNTILTFFVNDNLKNGKHSYQDHQVNIFLVGNEHMGSSSI